MAGLANHSGLSAPVLIAALGLWTIVPLGWAIIVFSRREV
jgi:Cu-processing system permease protein